MAIPIIVLLVSSCGAKSDPAGDEQAAEGNNQASEQTVDVNSIYKQRCVTCHDSDLSGALGGKTNIQQVGARLTKEQIAAQIQNGGNGMIAFKGTLSENEINALSEWLAGKK